MSQDSKHTSGPWCVERNGITVKQTGKYAMKICQAFEVFMGRKQREANAHLIAAAPDMLDALRDAREAFGTISASNGATRESLKQINAAIAKAEGRAS